VDCSELKKGIRIPLKPNQLQIVAVVRGKIEIQSGSDTVTLDAGQFCLIPAELTGVTIIARTDSALLQVEAS